MRATCCSVDKVVKVGTPTLKLLNPRGGRYSGQPCGPEGIMPRVPGPVTNPNSDSVAKLSFGRSVVTAVRMKLSRASLTAVGPKICVAQHSHLGPLRRRGAEPGALAEGSGLTMVESSKK